ncbi:hypothetical protein ACIBCM_07535 [Streptomyces sp. NPDC051018]|uniref:hypothetical protein n=1 Tax=Streptomyces sp. NPDC051018 TaxID=3365639 RepID=UPI0037BA56FA
MTLKSLQVDATWVRRLVALAGRGWDRSELEDVFLRHGWARLGAGGRPEIAWGGGAASPHDIDGGGEGGIGWRLELGDPPGKGAEDAYVRLSCALFWPAFGEEPQDAEHTEDEEDDLDGDYGPAWIRRPGATRADFHAEYDRLGALIRAELGEPDRTTSADMDEYGEIWNRDTGEVVLQRTDDINSYSHYDVIALRVGIVQHPR